MRVTSGQITKFLGKHFLIIEDDFSDKPFVQNNFHLNPICSGMLTLFVLLLFETNFCWKSNPVTSSREGKQTARETWCSGSAALTWKQWKKHPKTECGWRSMAISDSSNVYQFSIRERLDDMISNVVLWKQWFNDVKTPNPKWNVYQMFQGPSLEIMRFFLTQPLSKVLLLARTWLISQMHKMFIANLRSSLKGPLNLWVNRRVLNVTCYKSNLWRLGSKFCQVLFVWFNKWWKYVVKVSIQGSPKVEICFKNQTLTTNYCIQWIPEHKTCFIMFTGELDIFCGIPGILYTNFHRHVASNQQNLIDGSE